MELSLNDTDDLVIKGLETEFLTNNDDDFKISSVLIRTDPKISKTRSFDFLSEEQKINHKNDMKILSRIFSKNDHTKNDTKSTDNDDDDDDEISKFLERKYNEYGQDIHMNLKKSLEEKKNNQIDLEILKNNQDNNIARVPHLNTRKLEMSRERPIKEDMKLAPFEHQQPIVIYTDPIFGMRLIRPLISSTLLSEKMMGKLPVPFASIRNFSENSDKSKDWVIAGVIVSKSPVKTSQNGSQYCIWKISDLKGVDIKLISLFLFKNAYKELWKTVQGMVIAILNPVVLDKRESKDEATLSVDNPQKIMLLGQSKDLGTCRSKKKNGDPCTAVVNLNSCEYCIFHVKQEYGKVSKRSELQSVTSGRGLNELRNKVLGKNEVFYGGQSYTAIPAKKNQKLVEKDKKRLLTLSEFYQTPSKVGDSVHSKKKVNSIKKAASTIEINVKQRKKDLERLAILKKSSNNSNVNSSSNRNISDHFMNFSFTNRTPTLSQSSFSIELTTLTNIAEKAKSKAIKILKKNPIEKSNPNYIKDRGSEAGKKRALEELQREEFIITKRQKLEEDKLEDAKKDRIQRIIDASSSHLDLVKIKENEHQEKYFNNLERKEAMEEKMLNTYRVPCKAVSCLKCKYLAFSAADRCREEKHPLKVTDSEKRFFKCGNCGNRTVTLYRIPKFSCKNCQSSKWQKTTMIKETKVVGNQLSIRGDEEQFINGSGAVNVNLLVPEEFI